MLKTILLIILIPFFSSPSLAAQPNLLPDLRPTGLMVDFLRNPSLGAVNDSIPDFSWIDNFSVGAKQVSYQILVALSRKNLENGKGDLWNSSKVLSQQSVNVKYSGHSLKPKTTYFWCVKIENSLSKSILTSEIQEFKTGSFKKDGTVSVMPLVKTSKPPVLVIQKNLLGNYFADFGKAAFGTLRLQIESQNADSLVVHLGEKLEATGLIKRNPGGTIRYRFIGLPVKKGTHLYTLRIPSIPRNSKYPAIVMPPEVGEVTPFRYCEIESHSSATVCKSAEQIAVNYYWDDRESSFICSDSVLSKVWDLCRYSIHATSFCGIYVDGDRERIPYEADAYINQLGQYCTDREYSMARYSHEYLMVNPTWPTEWIMHSVMIAYTDFLYSGDTRSLSKFYNELKYKSLIALEREDGLISTRTGLVTETILHDIHIKVPIKDIVDWPAAERDGNEMPEVNTVINAFHYESLRLMALIANALGHKEDERLFNERAGRVKGTINRLLFDRAGMKYNDGEGSEHASLHANIFPMAFGVADEDMIHSVAAYIRSRGMACSVYAAQYLLESLYAAGEDEAALDLMRSTSERSWWNMIKSGSTITLEAWDEKYKPNLDWNHAWGAVPANMVTRGLWGILPLTPGFGVAQIKPQTGGLTYSQIKVPTIRGLINCEFKTDDNTRFDLQVSIPSNMTALVYVPVRTIINPVLFVNDKRINGKREGKFFAIKTDSGKTNFSVRGGEK